MGRVRSKERHREGWEVIGRGKFSYCQNHAVCCESIQPRGIAQPTGHFPLAFSATAYVRHRRPDRHCRCHSLPGRATPSPALRRTVTSSKGHAVDTALFTTGSCVTFSPTFGNRHKTVFLDAGHGGLDPGGVGVTDAGQRSTRQTKRCPWNWTRRPCCEPDGFQVVDSRTRNSTVARIEAGDTSGGIFTVQGEHDDVAARDECANRAKANVLVGIYFDVGASPDNAGSITGYDTDRPFSTSNLNAPASFCSGLSQTWLRWAPISRWSSAVNRL